jgi:hypothetical protein
MRAPHPIAGVGGPPTDWKTSGSTAGQPGHHDTMTGAHVGHTTHHQLDGTVRTGSPFTLGRRARQARRASGPLHRPSGKDSRDARPPDRREEGWPYQLDERPTPRRIRRGMPQGWCHPLPRGTRIGPRTCQAVPRTRLTGLGFWKRRGTIDRGSRTGHV